RAFTDRARGAADRRHRAAPHARGRASSGSDHKWAVSKYRNKKPRRSGAFWHIGLFCRRSLFDRGCFDFFALFIRFGEEPIDDAGGLLRLHPSLLRFLLLLEEFVVDFPTHWILHL